MFVEFIIPTYNRVWPLKTLLSSLYNQTDNDWIATVILDDDHLRTDFLDIINPFISERVKIEFSGRRYNDFGHTPREIIKQRSHTDYILMTGDDNYYTPNLIKELKIAATNSPGLIYWDMIHSHYDYQYFKCEPRTHQIDMGAFATRTDLAKQIKLSSGFAADGDFIEDFRRKFPLESRVKINKVLYVHN